MIVLGYNKRQKALQAGGSKEDGTVGYNLPNQIDEETKIRRYNEIMEIQQKISRENNKKRIGQFQKGLIVGFSEEKNAYLVRSMFNAPDEIDGNIYCYGEEEYCLGDKIYFEVIDSDDYDLYGKIINK